MNVHLKIFKNGWVYIYDLEGTELARVFGTDPAFDFCDDNGWHPSKIIESTASANPGGLTNE